MTKTLIFYEEQLLSLTIISYIAFDINSSGIKPSASFGPTSSSNKNILDNVAWIVKELPSTTILKLRTDPWMTPTNHRLSSNLAKCFPIL